MLTNNSFSNLSFNGHFPAHVSGRSVACARVLASCQKNFTYISEQHGLNLRFLSTESILIINQYIKWFICSLLNTGSFRRSIRN
jgi:hypothetical protein